MERTKANVEARRKQIDARIATLEREIIDLKSERNSISPTGLLPPEILEQIFLAFRDLCPKPSSVTVPWHPHRPQAADSVRTVSWSILTEVSRQWRLLSVECPQLWSEPAFHTPGWAELMLLRSKEAPLTIDLSGRIHAKARPWVDKAISQAQRLKSVKIDSCDEWVQEIVRWTMISPAPNLESLDLVGETSTSVGFQRFSRPDLPYQFLGNEVPQLRRLILAGWGLGSWAIPYLPKLTSLHMSGSALNPLLPRSRSVSHLSKNGGLMNALEMMPHLTELKLEEVLSELGPAAETYPVKLRFLKVLSLAGSLTDVTTFLGNIVVPSSATIALRCSAGARDSTTYSNFGDVLYRSWLSNFLEPSSSAKDSQITPRSFKSIALQHRNSYLSSEIQINCHFDPVDFHSKKWGADSTVPLQVSIEPWGEDDEEAEFLEHLLPALPLSGLLTLNLGCDITSGGIKALSCLPQIHTVSLNQDSASQLICYLTDDCRGQEGAFIGSENPPNLGFPALNVISLNGINFSYYSSALKRVTILEDMLDMLMARYEAGGEIESLHFRNSFDLSKVGLRRLQEVCVNVDWEGHLREWEEEASLGIYDYSDVDDWDDGRDFDRYGYDSD